MFLLIFEKEKLSFNLIEVIEIKQNDVNLFNSGRNFDALSFRYDADTVLKNENQTVSLKSGSVCYVPAGVDYSRISKKDNLIVIQLNSLNYFSKEIEYFYPENKDKIYELFCKILKYWENKEIGYMHICKGILYEIFALLYKENHQEESYDEKIKNSVIYIAENYMKPDISVKTAAEKSNISEVYFRKLFKEQFGISPKKHIINLRISYAVNLIENGYYSLSEIAEKSGFCDYKYFSTEFHRITGYPPSKYYYNYTENENN